MSTLVDLKKARGLTNVQVGRAIGVSAGTAGNILHGTHCHVYSDEQIQKLADVLGVTFERCWYAMCESYNERMGTPGKQHQRLSEGLMQAAEVVSKRVPEMRERIMEKTPVPRPLATVEAVSYLE